MPRLAECIGPRWLRPRGRSPRRVPFRVPNVSVKSNLGTRISYVNRRYFTYERRCQMHLSADSRQTRTETSTPLACVLRRARRVRLPCTPASDLRCESSGCLESNFFLVPIIGQDFWRGRAPARDFRGFADLLPRTFPRVSSQTGVYDGPGLCIVRVHPPVVHHKFECGELPVMSRRHFRGDRVVTSQITKTPFRSGWFAPIEACTIRYEHRHAAKWAQWNGYMGLVAILNFGYYRPRRIKIRCLNWP